MNHARETDILLIEDNDNDVALILRALRKQHLDNRVHIINDGAEAVRYFASIAPAGGIPLAPVPRVIFLDLKLPKVNGMEIIRHIRAGDRTRTVPVIILTSSREEKDIAESYRLGANSYIVKPVDFEQFLTAVTTMGTYWLTLNQYPL